MSAHLLAAIPNPTAAQKEQYKASNILFGKPYEAPDYSSPAVQAAWWAVTVPAAAIAVRQATAANRPAAYANLLTKLDRDRYIDYLCTLQATEALDVDEQNIRMWRHPVDLKWRCIAWDGDIMNWHANAPNVVPQYLNDLSPVITEQ